MEKRIKNAYRKSLIFAKSHYENFPVVLFTVPKELRNHIAVVYQFARQADDIADEGQLSSTERMNLLNEYENDFINAINKKYKNDFWLALHKTILKFNIPPKLFIDLISAFKQDVEKNRYATLDELLQYCSKSANPVGRILLEIFNVKQQKAFELSDKICTALQITNFLQDVSIDLKKNRIYLPVNLMIKYNIEVNEIFENNLSDNFKKFIGELIDLTDKMFYDGKEIQKFVPKIFLTQIRMTILGGRKILEKIRKNNYDVFYKRPKLNTKDLVLIFIKSFRNV